jgi:gliding motility-associated-like protein
VSPTNAATVTVAPGTWNLQVTVDDGPAGSCPGIGTLTVIVDQPITADIAQDDACADQVFITATPNGPYLYRWYRNGALDLALGGPQVLATAANDNQQYRVEIFNPANGCTYASPTEAIQIDGELTVSITSTPPCDNAPFTLTASPNRTVSSYAWAHEGTTIGGQVASTLEDTRAGTYEVTVTQASCSATGEIEVIPSPSTPGNLTPLARICPDPANQDPDTRQALLDPGAFDSYNWFKDGNTMGITTPTLTVVEEGIYEVDLINSFGCASSDKTEVIVDCDPVIVGPNAFRPGSSVVQNGEMVNQAFKLFTFFIDDTDFSIFIFNRWGEMVYQSNERDFRWNGGYNNNLGQLLPPGTYSYLVRYKSSYRPEQGVQEKRGGVVLMR